MILCCTAKPTFRHCKDTPSPAVAAGKTPPSLPLPFRGGTAESMAARDGADAAASPLVARPPRPPQP